MPRLLLFTYIMVLGETSDIYNSLLLPNGPPLVPVFIEARLSLNRS